MKPSQLFVNLDDFSNRFKDTIIYYNDIPKYVIGVTTLEPGNMEKAAFQVYDFKDGLNLNKNPELILLNDEAVNFRNYNIGYIQYKENMAVWVTRCPNRQWKQGLRRDQCQLSAPIDDDIGHLEILGANSITYNMLCNNYKTVDSVLEVIKSNPNKNSIIAIHKNFAIIYSKNTKKYYIEYKGVGLSSMTDKGLKFNEDFKYLLNIPEYGKLLDGLFIQ